MIDIIKDVVVYVLATSIWNFLVVYILGFIISILGSVMTAKVKKKTLNIEETVNFAALSWIFVFASVCEFLFDRVMGIGKWMTARLCKKLSI